MNITSAQYRKNLEGDNYAVIAVIDGQTLGVPMQVGNRHYDEILRQVEAETLTIQDAD
tara:strand:+ start:422 stop:595 length:174 start_codon:yes stop_codon:yes gene_type:complete